MKYISMVPNKAWERGGLVYYGEAYCLSREEAKVEKEPAVNVYGLYGNVLMRSYD